MFLIDTVTLSELRKRDRDPMVVAWFERQRTTDLFLSLISIGEIERGIARQRSIDPAFSDALAVWLDRVLTLYGERLIPFDLRMARRWGALSAALGNDSADRMIAATALGTGSPWGPETYRISCALDSPSSIRSVVGPSGTLKTVV